MFFQLNKAFIKQKITVTEYCQNIKNGLFELRIRSRLLKMF
uniref:Uncharacterized protein n=1 Tax=Anguilla anguilla TaxID=7936 RepID=A0A0E9QHH4_ANGAN